MNTTMLNHAMKQYQHLSGLQKKIVQRLALLYCGVEERVFVMVMMHTMSQSSLTNKAIHTALAQLRKAGLVDSQLNVKSEVQHHVMQQALLEKRSVTEKEFIAYYREQAELEHYGYYNKTWDSAYALLNLAIYQNDDTFIRDQLMAEPRYCRELMEDVVLIASAIQAEDNWIQQRSVLVRNLLTIAKLNVYYQARRIIPDDFQFWLSLYKKGIESELPPSLIDYCCQIDICLGRLDNVSQRISRDMTSAFACTTRGSLAFLANQPELAWKYYETAIKQFRKQYNLKNRRWCLEDMHGLLYFLILLHDKKDSGLLQKTLNAYERQTDSPDMSYHLFSVLNLSEQGQRDEAKTAYKNLARERTASPDEFGLLGNGLFSLVAYWIDAEDPFLQTSSYLQLWKQYAVAHPLLAHIYAELAAKNNDTEADMWLEKSPFGELRLADLFEVKQAWEYQLNRLQNLLAPGSEKAAKQARRLAWLVDPENLDIRVLEQKLNVKGKWSKGRAIALSRMHRPEQRMDYLTTQDKKALAGLSESYGWYTDERYRWDYAQTLTALIGHPLIFHGLNPSVQLEFVAGEVELHIEQEGKQYIFSLSETADDAGVLLVQETQHRYKVINFTEELIEVSQVVGEKGLKVPAAAKQQVLELIQSSGSGIRISTDVDEAQIPSVDANPQCCLQFLPVKEGLRLSIWTRPFTDQGPYSHPGEGRKTLISDIIVNDEPEKRYKAVRDLVKEKQNFDALINACPSLSVNAENQYEWHLEQPADCLEVLQELNDYQEQNPLRIEWPQGQKFRLKRTVSADNMKLSITSNQQWFEYDGEVKIDDQTTLQMRTLLDLLDSSNGRFIEVKDGEFIALTEQFKQQLEQLRGSSEGNKLYHLNANVLMEIAEQAEDVSHDKTWQTHVKTIANMQKHEPELPSTLQAELRDYQLDGFRYLSRLAHWGIGACLADDMGLGKTVQSIALLLEQASKGPSLVVAPTSVCFNWVNELNNFAPTLNVYTLSTKDRKATIEKLSKMDVLICSYGLLIQLEEPLLAQQWQTIVLDEAQAIKNVMTKRWKVATKLPAKVRVALTGTPIENHLGELWSIFRFLNPGLLGSQKHFQQQFSLPIERYQDKTTRRVLKNLVQPYILRRLKRDVLLELPPKTEQTLFIEPSAEEQAFYDALRKKALERIENTVESQAGNKRFTILAEIGKLRQACCDTSLVNADMQLENSKLKRFFHLVEDLRENGHKVLVFSQFVRYLAIVKAQLDERNITYQYLDGQTPAAKRRDAVNAFQAGEGDVFLLSLKAGGTGLNLTAADYVIHLDPWWNPAVEDQASDRAHRIGQQRAVTVYRLIMQHSIEEKIIKMHASKRDLASDLLTGSDMSGKLDEDALIGLIGNGG